MILFTAESDYWLRSANKCCCGPMKVLCSNISKTMLEWELSEKLQLTITNFLWLNPTNYLDLELVNPTSRAATTLWLLLLQECNAEETGGDCTGLTIVFSLSLIPASSSHKYRWAEISAFEPQGRNRMKNKTGIILQRLQSLSSRLSIKCGTKKPEKYKSPSLRLPAINLRNCYNLLWCWEFCQEMINSELSGFRF